MAGGDAETPVIEQEEESVYRPPAQKTLKDIVEADKEDESLLKYKEALLGQALEKNIIVEPENPKNVSYIRSLLRWKKILRLELIDPIKGESDHMLATAPQHSLQVVSLSISSPVMYLLSSLANRASSFETRLAFRLVSIDFGPRRFDLSSRRGSELSRHLSVVLRSSSRVQTMARAPRTMGLQTLSRDPLFSLFDQSECYPDTASFSDTLKFAKLKTSSAHLKTFALTSAGDCQAACSGSRGPSRCRT